MFQKKSVFTCVGGSEIENGNSQIQTAQAGGVSKSLRRAREVIEYDRL